MTNAEARSVAIGLMSQEDLRQQLSSLPILEGIGEETLSAFEAELELFDLPGGSTLFREGDQSKALYIVIHGRVGAFMRDADGQERLVSQIHRGETVGELGLISGEPRTATLIALRDSTLLRLTKSAFERLIEQHPKAMQCVLQQLVDRLQRAAPRAAPDDAPRTFLITPLDPGVAYADLARGLAEALSGLGERVHLLDAEVAGQSTEWFHEIEAAHDRILYLAEPKNSAWTHRCFRQADRILYVATGRAPQPDRPPVEPPPTETLLPSLELVLLQEPAAPQPGGAAPWLERLHFDFHTHIRSENRADLARLARLITGRAVGLVLSGGGARGIAHIGVIRALRRAGVPLDLVGGTSMGSIIAAGIALEWDDEQLKHMISRSFADGNPFSDYTLPLISLFRGRKVTKILRNECGEAQIEDLWRNYFCVSTNLTTGTAKVHRRGSLWKAIRASISLPGLLPPVIEEEQVLVDGGMINHLPGDVMREMQRGPVIGVDTGSDRGLISSATDLEEKSLWWLLRHGRKDVPGIVRILMSAGTVSSAAQTIASRSQLDLLLQPPLGSFNMLDWKAYERAIDIGYRSTMETLEQLETPLFQALTACRATHS